MMNIRLPTTAHYIKGITYYLDRCVGGHLVSTLTGSLSNLSLVIRVDIK